MVFDSQFLFRRILADHVWWETGRIPFYGGFKKRDYFREFLYQVQQTALHRAVVLMGPRRVGKTVMMYQAIQELIDSGVNPKKILYFSLDTPIYTNVSLEKLIQKSFESSNLNMDGAYIFFDEIQYFKDWEIHLKSLVDTNRKTKFIASGSAAAALRMKSVESGAGRFTDFFLPPLTFVEYIDLNAYNHLLEEVDGADYGLDKMFKATDIDKLNAHFVDYINFGGFPEIALNTQEVKNPEQIIQKDITDKVIMKDLPSLFGIENTLELQQFFNVLAYRSGEILNYQNVSAETRTDIKTVKKYITYLESAFLVKLLHRVDVTAKRFKNIMQFKVYLMNPSLFTGLFGKINPDDERFPHLVETAIFAQFSHNDYSYLRYASWKKNGNEGEVDLIRLTPNFQKANWAIEVKWSDSPQVDKLKFFMKKNKLKKGVITSKTKFVEGQDLLIIPSAVFAYSIGKEAKRATI